MGIRNGDSYLASLKDERNVIYDGKRIADVVQEPGFRTMARGVAQFYDFQGAPENLDVMTYRSDDGERVGMAFKEARTKEDLRQRAAAYAAWAEVTCGFMGRSPDYMNTLLATLSTMAPSYAAVRPELGERARALYLDARRRDLFYTHTFAEPFKVVPPPGEEMAGPCRVVAETSEGLVISGSRSLATLAPFADMNLDIGAGAAYERDGVAYSLGFVTPVSARGLRWVCRDKMGGDAPHAESPLAARADEMDCVAVFDRCLIPWDCVYGLVPVTADVHGMEYVLSGQQHQVLIRSVAKARFLVGLAHLLADASKITRFINIQERLGDMVCWMRTLEAFAVAVVEDPLIDARTSSVYPNPRLVEVAGIWCAQFFPKMISHVLDIGGSRFVTSPQQRTLEHIGELAEQHFRGGGANAKENIALFRLGWEVAGSTWGSRISLYERFHFGDATLRKVVQYLHFDTETCVEMVRRLLRVPPIDRQVFPEATRD